MLKFKTMIAVSTVIALLACLCISAAADAGGVTLDGQAVTAAAVSEKGTLYVQVAPVVEQIGAVVKNNTYLKALQIDTCDKTVVITDKSKVVKVNGTPVKLIYPVAGKSDGFYVPAGFFKSVYGMAVATSGNTAALKYFSGMSGTLKVGGSTTIQPILENCNKSLLAMNNTLSISTAFAGSGPGIKGANDGTFNVGAASRDLTDSEKTSMPDLKYFMIGKDGIAVIVNKQNKTNSLTTQQVIDIFTGKITNWKDMGGENAPVLVQTREPGSGTNTAFQDLALGGKAIKSSATPNGSNGLMRNAVMSGKNAVGFLSVGYLNDTVKAVSINGVIPSVVTCANRTWPYVRSLNLLSKGKPTGLTAKYINYVLSPAGQKILNTLDYIPLSMVRTGK